MQKIISSPGLLPIKLSQNLKTALLRPFPQLSFVIYARKYSKNLSNVYTVTGPSADLVLLKRHNAIKSVLIPSAISITNLIVFTDLPSCNFKKCISTVLKLVFPISTMRLSNTLKRWQRKLHADFVMLMAYQKKNFKIVLL